MKRNRTVESAIDDFTKSGSSSLEGIASSSMSDRRAIKAHLLRDIKLVTDESVMVKLDGESNIVIASEDQYVKEIVETYSRVYFEVSFLFDRQLNNGAM